MASRTRLIVLEEFLWKQEIDALVQEITIPLLSAIRRYTAYKNEGRDRRRTAILAKESITITNIKRIPSGRGMAAMFNTTWIVSINSPSGDKKENERKMLYNNDVTYVLPTAHADMIMAGDFNCIVSNIDSTGTNNYSCTALANIVNGFGVIDAWDTSTSRRIYTHYTPNGASRIDRMYVTRNILSKKQSVETVAAAFIDHLAVVLRIAIDTPLTLRGRVYWRLNISLSDKNFHSILRKQCAKWKRHKKYYSHSVMWWGRYIKRMIRQFFINEGPERLRDRLAMATFYHDAIYNILQEMTVPER